MHHTDILKINSVEIISIIIIDFPNLDYTEILEINIVEIISINIFVFPNLDYIQRYFR